MIIDRPGGLGSAEANRNLWLSFLVIPRKGFSGFLPSEGKKEGNTGIPRNSGGMYNLVVMNAFMCVLGVW